MNLVLDPREFRLLEGLRLNPRRSFGGRVRGERLTRKKGASTEFADYREYTEGDDLRHLDWNVLARLDSPVMRTYRDEEDLAVHLMLDGSPSMDFGEISKIDFAREIALAIGYVALCSGDAVFPVALGSGPPSRSIRGRVGYPRLAHWATTVSASDRTPDRLSVALRAFAHSAATTGLAIVVSDGLDPDIGPAIRAVAGRGHEVWFIQILSEAELDPDLEGDLRLLDGEGGSPREITANRAVLAEYRARLISHNAGLRDAVTRVGGRYALLSPTVSIDRALKDPFKREGWLT